MRLNSDRKYRRTPQRAVSGRAWKITTIVITLGTLTWLGASPVAAATSGGRVASTGQVHKLRRPRPSEPGKRPGAPRGLFTLQNHHTDNCLDDSFADGLRAIGCNGDNNQNWDIIGSGHYHLKNYYTGYCVDDSRDYGLRAIDCNGDRSQTWYAIAVGGLIFIYKNENTGNCLDDSFLDHLRAVACTDDTEQEWITAAQ